MNKTVCFLIFVTGVTVGSITTWQFVKNKYEKIAQEEIDSVKEIFFGKETESTKKAEYNEIIQKQEYTNYSNLNNNKEDKENDEYTDRPYVISPDEFGENDDYETISLIYYSDNILADDKYEIVYDVDDIVGIECLNHFGEYEDDSVFVRNDKRKSDYEILLDRRTYTDVVESKPYLR